MNFKLLATTSAIIFTTSAASAATLEVLTEDYAPFNFEREGKVAGISTEIVQEVMKRAGVDYQLTLTSWARAYNNALNKNNTCVFSTTFTEAREPLFKWVGPLVKDKWSLFAKEGSDITISSLEEAKGYSIGTYNADAQEIYLQENGYTVSSAANDNLNLKKLNAGRIKVWATGAFKGPFAAAQSGMKLKHLIDYKETEMSLACNKGVDQSIIDKLNATLKAVQADGTSDKISAAYK